MTVIFRLHFLVNRLQPKESIEKRDFPNKIMTVFVIGFFYIQVFIFHIFQIFQSTI